MTVLDVLLVVFIALGVGITFAVMQRRADALEDRLHRERIDKRTLELDLKLADEHWRDAERRLAQGQELSEEQRKALADPANRCVHCGGVHAIACPRIKRIRFRGDGQTPLEVEFWEEWPRDRVVFPEDVLEMPRSGDIVTD